MKKRRGPLHYNDLLVIILMALIGASLVLTALVGVQIHNRTEFSETERLSYRNRLVQLQLENRIETSRRRLIEASRNVAPGDLRGLLQRLNDAPGQLSGTEWRAYDAGGGEKSRVPYLTLYRETPDEPVRGAIIFDSAESSAGSAHPVILFDVTAVASLLRSDFTTPSEVVVVDNRGNEIVTVQLGDEGMIAIHTEWAGTGLAPVTAFPPHLGVINRTMTDPEGIRTVDGERWRHSVMPLPGIDAYLDLRDPPSAPTGVSGNSVALVVLVGAILYALIVVLFVSYRRLVVDQTLRLSKLSEQKNLLFSLLSHNLKNDLAAISAEAQTNGGSQGVLAPVADASRTISNSLYYVQFQEGTFHPPPLEPVDIADLIEFLTLRCTTEATAKSQTLRTYLPEKPILVDTNLAMALEALERLLINAIQYSPDSSEIAVRIGHNGTGPSLIIADQGPGLPAAAEQMLSRPVASLLSADPLSNGSLRGIGIYVARRMLATIGGGVHVVRTGSDGAEIGVTFAPLAGKG